ENNLTGPVAGTNQFTFSSSGAGPCPGVNCTITYTGTTQVTNNTLFPAPTRTVTTTLVLTLTSGAGSIVSVPNSSPTANNSNGDIAKLFLVTGGSFTVTATVQGSDVDFSTIFTSGPTGLFDQSHGDGAPGTPTQTAQDISHVDLAFYW